MRSRKPFSVPEQVPLYFDTPGLVAGVDEAGRGPLAGPVVAAAVILDDRKPIAGLDDSKKLSEKRREKLFEDILARALCCSIAEASVQEIDSLNILQATLLAMQRAVAGRQDEAVPVRPAGGGGIELQELGIEDSGNVGHAHGHSRVAGIGRLDRIHRQGADGIGHGRQAGGFEGHAECSGQGGKCRVDSMPPPLGRGEPASRR